MEQAPKMRRPERHLVVLSAALFSLAGVVVQGFGWSESGYWPGPLSLFVVFLLAFAAELKTPVIHYGDLSFALTWSEVSLVIGLYFLGQRTHILCVIAANLLGRIFKGIRGPSGIDFVKLLVVTALQAAKVGIVVLVVAKLGNPPSTSPATGLSILIGVLCGEVFGSLVLATVFRLSGQRPATGEWIRGVTFGLVLTGLLTTASFAVVSVSLWDIGVAWFVVAVPLAAIPFGPFVAQLIEEKNEWARHGRFIRTVDNPDSTLQEMASLLRTQLGVNRLEMVAQFDKASDTLMRTVTSESGFEESLIDVDGDLVELWARHRTNVANRVSQFGPGHDTVPEYLGNTPDALVVTVGTTDGTSVWAASGYGGRGTQRSFPESLHEPFTSMCWSVHNVLDARRRLADVQRRATHDSVTGLVNREQLRSELETEVQRAHDGIALPVTVAVLDLDEFKAVNDTWGHHVGDLFLIHVAKKLIACVPAGSLVARLSGDEFGVIIRDRTAAEATAAFEKIISEVAEPFHPIPNHAHRGSISAGYVSYPSAVVPKAREDMPQIASQLLRHADAAMYTAKHAKRTAPLEFNLERDGVTEHAAQLAADVTNALSAGLLKIYLQPIFATPSLRPDADRVVISLEALARIEAPAGMIMPDQFIRIAEKTKQIHAVTERVLDLACAQLAEWDAFDVSIAVNLSVANLVDLFISDKIKAALDRHNVAPERLVVEVTESMTMLDQFDPIAVLNQIRSLGVRVSMDDFGTGHSSLARLTDLPIDEVKIDRHFVVEATRIVHDDDLVGLERVRKAKTILSSMVAMARQLGLPTTVEGIETQDGLSLVDQLGATKVQGYVASRPLPPKAAAALLAVAAAPRKSNFATSGNVVRLPNRVEKNVG